MILDDLIASFRIDAGDISEPMFWSDETVVRLLVEAEEEAAIRKRLLPDEIPVAITAPTRIYPFTALFEITRAELVAAGAEPIELCIVSRDAMNRIDPEWRRSTRKPAHLIQEDTRIVLVGLIDQNYTLNLEGLRLPKTPLNVDHPEASPEIAPVHHRFLGHWALHRAYGVQDSDSFDEKRSARELGLFEQYFGPRPDADLRKDVRADVPHHNLTWLT